MKDGASTDREQLLDAGLIILGKANLAVRFQPSYNAYLREPY